VTLILFAQAEQKKENIQKATSSFIADMKAWHIPKPPRPETKVFPPLWAEAQKFLV
jgi:hypothetical protein